MFPEPGEVFDVVAIDAAGEFCFESDDAVVSFDNEIDFVVTVPPAQDTTSYPGERSASTGEIPVSPSKVTPTTPPRYSMP